MSVLANWVARDMSCECLLKIEDRFVCSVVKSRQLVATHRTFQPVCRAVGFHLTDELFFLIIKKVSVKYIA